MAVPIALTVNGVEHFLELTENEPITLLEYLRHHLGLMGAKNGCGQGHCGACTVIVDGQAKRACLLKLVRLDGSEVETVENLSRDGELHPLQTAFLRLNAVQCGFCTPGMLMSAKALLDRNPDPSEREIRTALAGNICRCTGYLPVLRAVRQAAAVLRGEAPSAGSSVETAVGGVGQSPQRRDGRAKVTGQPIYADDMVLPEMVYGKLLLSAQAHARIIRIDTGEAEKAPGVVAVLTARDIPGRNGFGLLNPHQPVLAGEVVRFLGDPVALVLAESAAEAEAALPLIQVVYQPLPGIFSPAEAQEPGAEPIHAHGHIISQTRVRRGDVEAGFRQAAAIVEADYQVPFVEHAYLEPEAGLSCPDGQGGVILWTASQGSHAFREMIAASLALAEDKVRVIYTPAGGAFGGKEEPTVQIHCALGSLLTDRPVKMTLSRMESIRMSTKRHAERMHYRLGASEDGRLLAFEAQVDADTGAYDSLGKPVVFRSGVVTAGPYQIPHVRIDSTGWYTNNPPGGAFRGFGSTQVAFAAEVTMDMLARQLGLDPFQLRRINALESGAETVTGQVLGPGVGYLETLAAVETALQAERDRYQPAPGKKLGVGIASAYKNVGIGSGKSDLAGAILELDPQAGILLKVGAADMGQGSDTVLAQIAHEVTGIPLEEIQVVSNDTALCPSGQVTTASRQTYVSGQAVLQAAEKFRRDLIAALDGKPADQLLYQPKQVRCGEQGSYISWRELARRLQSEKRPLRAEATYVAPRTYPLPDHHTPLPGEDPELFNIHFAYVFATQAAIVQCDEVSGETQVLKVIAATDIGRAIHPEMAKGQVEGAVVMGIGYALSESFITDQGRIVSDTLAKLKLPRSSDAPEIDVILIEKEQPDGPFGAKGMGELPINPTAPAVINAIYDALGVRICSLPASPEKVRQALAEKNRGKG